MGQVEGKVAIVTGGASGIGAACAATLAREGAKVVVTDLRAAGDYIEVARTGPCKTRSLAAAISKQVSSHR
jgi:NAD(P)-dependent dehydrogenase (short-subunit alcohol dehydrogenase family)